MSRRKLRRASELRPPGCYQIATRSASRGEHAASSSRVKDGRAPVPQVPHVRSRSKCTIGNNVYDEDDDDDGDGDDNDDDDRSSIPNLPTLLPHYHQPSVPFTLALPVCSPLKFRPQIDHSNRTLSLTSHTAIFRHKLSPR